MTSALADSSQNPSRETVDGPLRESIKRSPFDREKVLLYIASLLATGVVVAIFFYGYMIPLDRYVTAIVSATKLNPHYRIGCYFAWREHAMRIQTGFALRLIAMMIGMMVTFVGMIFSIKGLEAGYQLDIKTGNTEAGLKTASAGLVLCTLGLALCAAAMLASQSMELNTHSVCLT